MQAAHLLGSHTQHKPRPRVLRPHFHRDHALLRADCHCRQHARRNADTAGASRRMALLHATHKPWQQGHGAHKKDDHDQRLRHAATIHG